MTILILVYAGVSLALGGAAMTVELWSPPTMLDRADGRGKFRSPAMKATELVVFGVFVALFWPILLIAALVDRRDFGGS